MNEVIFRSATLGDLSELLRLRFLAILEADGIDQHQETPDFKKAVQNYFREHLTNQTYFGAVAELNGRLISKTTCL